MSQDLPAPPSDADDAAPDAIAPGSATSLQGVKVELDIEDAPFLDEPEDEIPPEPKPEKKPEPEPKKAVAAPKGQSKFAALREKLLAKKKLLIIGAGGTVALLLILLALLLFLGGDDKPASPPVAAAPEPVHTIVPEPVREDAPQGPKYLFVFEPFFLERRGAEGEIRFLRCRFSVPTDNPMLYAELTGKTIAVRDAVYYYLVNKPLVFLSDTHSSRALKEDVISVINEHLSTEKIRELFIEDYFISGR